MSFIASLIIPTHNRSGSLKKMLECLRFQSFPSQDFEIVVVADGCTDGTVKMLKEHSENMNLVVCELEGLGASSARNKGASIAKGEYLIFVDDDMKPCADFVKTHLNSHNNGNTVVIGYSPLWLEPNASMHRMRLREWWEEKFQAMRNKHYRFRYNDLTSGNFSISSALFKKVNGFDTSLLCREDYELGFRLIEIGAKFHFAYGAEAYHCDKVTDLKRSMERKKSEGISDILMKKKHADFMNYEAMYYLRRGASFKYILLDAIKYAPVICDGLANLGLVAMYYLEKLKLRTPWWTINNYLHQYWYLRGLMEGVETIKELRQLVYRTATPLRKNQKLLVDLAHGLEKTEEQIDQIKPSILVVYYGTNFIGNIYSEPGHEDLKGKHLRKILKDRFSEKLGTAIFTEKFFESNL